MAQRLSDEDIEARLAGSEWERAGESIRREFTFADFAAAVGFVNRVAEAAEAANHHPDILVHAYRHVRIELSTHSAGGLTEADFALATQLDGLA
jgi:4a-hydroxytetrahydrobiopterin dehydratase